MLRLTRSECHHVARLLQGYLDGELEPPSTHRVAEHLEVCRRCGLEASTYLAIKSSIATAASRAVDEDAVSRLRTFAAGLSGPSE